MKKIVSMNIDEKVYSDYLKLCKQLGFVMSKQVENFMIKDLNRKKLNKSA